VLVSLLTCLLAGLCKNYQIDFHKIQREGGRLAKVCLFAWSLTALSAQIGYIAP